MPIKRKSNGSHVVDIHISQLIKDRRKQLAITQTELAKQSSLTPAAISQFESGTRKPSFDTLSNLADALKVTTDYLLGKRRENYDDLLADPKAVSYTHLTLPTTPYV